MEWPRWHTRRPALSKNKAALTPATSRIACRMVSMSPPLGRRVECLLDRCDGARRLDEDGRDRVALDDDEARPGLAAEGDRSQCAEPEFLPRLDHGAREESRHGCDALAV